MFGALAAAGFLTAGAGSGLGGVLAEQYAQQKQAGEKARDPDTYERVHGWHGQESRDVRRLAQNRVGKAWQAQRHKASNNWLNKPLTPAEEMEVRVNYEMALEETRFLLDRSPRTNGRDVYIDHQRGFGFYHPGLTRLETDGSAPPLISRDLMDRNPYHYALQEHNALFGTNRMW
jgi:hypothetical protein